MKKTFFSRLLAMLLLVVMVLSVFAACGKEEDPDDDLGGLSEDEKQAVQDAKKTAEEEDPQIEAIDYDGYEFTFICQPYKEDNAYTTKYMVSDQISGDLILDAVYRRNSMLGEKYNITFYQANSTDLITDVRKQVMAGQTEFDVIVASCGRLATLAREGLLLDLLSVDRFDMTKSYWDKNAAEQLKIGDKLYFTNCDFNTQEIGFVVYFNKQLIEDYDLTSPYEYIENNEWTLDNWAKLVKSVSKDYDGDGKMTELDQYGTLAENHNPRMFLYGCGVRATTNTAEGYPEFTLFKDKQKTTTAYDKLKAVFSDSQIAWNINDMPSDDTHGYPDKWDYARSLFCQDLYLFHYEGTNIIHQFADMESEFGIVPFPKYDANQKEFYSLYPYNCAMVAIPSTKTGVALEMTANIFEDLNYTSSYMLKPQWYEVLLKRRSTRDEESEQYLEVIKTHRVYDIGLYFDFGGLRSSILDVDCRGNNINTALARYSKGIEADIAKTYRDFGIEK